MLAQALLQSECPASITQKESSWTENVNTQLKQGAGKSARRCREECTPVRRRLAAAPSRRAYGSVRLAVRQSTVLHGRGCDEHGRKEDIEGGCLPLMDHHHQSAWPTQAAPKQTTELRKSSPVGQNAWPWYRTHQIPLPQSPPTHELAE